MQNKRVKIIEVVSMALSIYNDAVTEQSAKIWISALERFDLEDIQRAFNLYVQTSANGHFAPKPADIIRTITGTNEDRAKEAWSKVERAIRTVGQYQSVVFDDPIIHRVIYDLGGWVKVAQTQTMKDLGYLSYDFENRYKGYMDRGSIPVYPKYLAGDAETSLLSYGKSDLAKKKAIGEKTVCQLVYEKGVDPEKVESLPNSSSVSGMAIDFVNRLEQM